MGNCASNPCGENFDSNNIKDKYQKNKQVKEAFFQNELGGDKNFSKRIILCNNKDVPTKIDHTNIKMNTITNENKYSNTKTSNIFLDTIDSYENNETENFHHRKIQSSYNIKLTADDDFSHKSEFRILMNNPMGMLQNQGFINNNNINISNNFYNNDSNLAKNFTENNMMMNQRIENNFNNFNNTNFSNNVPFNMVLILKKKINFQRLHYSWVIMLQKK